MVEASREAAIHGLYWRQGSQVIDWYDYVDEQQFPGCEGMYVVTMIRDVRGK